MTHMTEPRAWAFEDPNNPPEPWVWGESPPDSVTMQVTTDQSAVRRYTLEPDLTAEGSWQPLGVPGNSHPWSYWLVPKYDPLTEVLPE
jgi:hypothetical protein